MQGTFFYGNTNQVNLVLQLPEVKDLDGVKHSNLVFKNQD